MKVFELFENGDNDFKAHEMPKMSPQEAADIILNECEEFVKSYRSSNKLLYRGVKEAELNSKMIYADIRKDRRPLYMGKLSHQLINDGMLALGLEAHRGNSIFTTTSQHIAGVWGGLFCIFVQDGWAGTVFEEVKYGYVFDELSDVADKIVRNEILDEQGKVDKMKSILKKLRPNGFYTGSELGTILKQGYEDILITGKRYYGLYDPHYSAFSKEVLELLK